ncbi:UNKNOWN [Stylonychia lemnae]|uniref:Uncharacterized protein n=1 Tax=Stylonychia lemnae TaxID=5949 RepID=A0A078B0S1_STYLE|nr:UNKNOWN [Stylonychia lemnae]|eukprot:CDW86957.1 UNKNOWN [Stylonychia lemnae]
MSTVNPTATSPTPSQQLTSTQLIGMLDNKTNLSSKASSMNSRKNYYDEEGDEDEIAIENGTQVEDCQTTTFDSMFYTDLASIPINDFKKASGKKEKAKPPRRGRGRPPHSFNKAKA